MKLHSPNVRTTTAGLLDRFKKTQIPGRAASDMHLNHAREGVCPKTGNAMQKVHLTGCPSEQEVWFCPESRIVLPVRNA